MIVSIASVFRHHALCLKYRHTDAPIITAERLLVPYLAMQQHVALRRTQPLLIRSVKSAIALLLTKVTKVAVAPVSFKP